MGIPRIENCKKAGKHSRFEKLEIVWFYLVQGKWQKERFKLLVRPMTEKLTCFWS
jgi:hypothetical protein